MGPAGSGCRAVRGGRAGERGRAPKNSRISQNQFHNHWAGKSRRGAREEGGTGGRAYLLDGSRRRAPAGRVRHDGRLDLRGVEAACGGGGCNGKLLLWFSLALRWFGLSRQSRRTSLAARATTDGKGLVSYLILTQWTTEKSGGYECPKGGEGAMSAGSRVHLPCRSIPYWRGVGGCRGNGGVVCCGVRERVTNL